ncbi:cbb3-type cytochrome oxidase assembly protein CcoS [Thiomicrorhabdus sp. zzn3]|uniref:cbb3-type cytochrome oxidase assembly protein CcoS n=1 Tax=Thiomicrorhabdus sp. zzn3 TaxID=3039775 RepID=UPI002436355F|nr:cbb3-type cytochrome oxidase assembly protein CcoS [Thiomicrorhabdus sp. zzn3]MDG6778917.1 cbb3-type cytochrome oxidase assembly protein CcoS [Thiomicrorhabdus sp. zzn3]
MEVIYGLIPMMLFFGFLVVVVFIWMAKNGHFDDLDGAANRIFMEDEYPEETKKTEANDAQAKQSESAEEKAFETEATDKRS